MDSPWIRAHAPETPKFLKGFCTDGPYECTGHIFSLYLYPFLRYTVIVIEVLGGGCEPQSWGRPGRGGRRGSGMVSFERALVSSYRICIVTFSMSLRVSEILPLLCSSITLHYIFSVHLQSIGLEQRTLQCHTMNGEESRFMR